VYTGRRLVTLLPVLVGVTLLVFAMLHLIPGDPVRLLLGDEAAPEDVARIRARLGLDQPVHVQFMRFAGHLLRGDLGTSLRSGIPVVVELGERLGPSLQLAAASVLVASVLGVLAGVVAAVRRGTWVDTLAMLGAVSGVSAPSFAVALVLILLFAVGLEWLPVAGYGTWGHLVLPTATLGLHYAAVIARLTRASMLEILHEDFVRTARAKGLAEGVVVYRHALRNALIPTVTIIGLQVGALLGGSVVVETVFAWPGIGRLVIDAVKLRDYPVVQGAVLYMALTFVLCNLAVDLLYGALDPRVRYA
jgi:ABC-type dipeptide/oligopeptide/nickel transport system permease component